MESNTLLMEHETPLGEPDIPLWESNTSLGEFNIPLLESKSLHSKESKTTLKKSYSLPSKDSKTTLKESNSLPLASNSLLSKESKTPLKESNSLPLASNSLLSKESKTPLKESNSLPLASILSNQIVSVNTPEISSENIAEEIFLRLTSGSITDDCHRPNESVDQRLTSGSINSSIDQSSKLITENVSSPTKATTLPDVIESNIATELSHDRVSQRLHREVSSPADSAVTTTTTTTGTIPSIFDDGLPALVTMRNGSSSKDTINPEERFGEVDTTTTTTTTTTSVIEDTLVNDDDDNNTKTTTTTRSVSGNERAAGNVSVSILNERNSTTMMRHISPSTPSGGEDKQFDDHEHQHQFTDDEKSIKANQQQHSTSSLNRRTGLYSTIIPINVSTTQEDSLLDWSTKINSTRENEVLRSGSFSVREDSLGNPSRQWSSVSNLSHLRADRYSSEDSIHTTNSDLAARRPRSTLYGNSSSNIYLMDHKQNNKSTAASGGRFLSRNILSKSHSTLPCLSTNATEPDDVSYFGVGYPSSAASRRLPNRPNSSTIERSTSVHRSDKILNRNPVIATTNLPSAHKTMNNRNNIPSFGFTGKSASYDYADTNSNNNSKSLSCINLSAPGGLSSTVSRQDQSSYNNTYSLLNNTPFNNINSRSHKLLFRRPFLSFSTFDISSETNNTKDTHTSDTNTKDNEYLTQTYDTASLGRVSRSMSFKERLQR